MTAITFSGLPMTNRSELMLPGFFSNGQAHGPDLYLGYLQRCRNSWDSWLSSPSRFCPCSPVNSPIILHIILWTWGPRSMFNAVCFIFLPHFLVSEFMMTFSTVHKIFINVITNNFHRSSKLILLLLSAVLPSVDAVLGREMRRVSVGSW